MNNLEILKNHYEELIINENDVLLIKVWKCKLDTIKECIEALKHNIERI